MSRKSLMIGLTVLATLMIAGISAPRLYLRAQEGGSWHFLAVEEQPYIPIEGDEPEQCTDQQAEGCKKATLKFSGGTVLTAVARDIPPEKELSSDVCASDSTCILLIDKDLLPVDVSTLDEQAKDLILSTANLLVPHEVEANGQISTEYVGLVTAPPVEPFAYDGPLKSSVTYVVVGHEEDPAKQFTPLAEATATFQVESAPVSMEFQPTTMAVLSESKSILQRSSPIFRIASFWKGLTKPLTTHAAQQEGGSSDGLRNCRAINSSVAPSTIPVMSVVVKGDMDISLDEKKIAAAFAGFTAIKPFNEFSSIIQGVVDSTPIEEQCANSDTRSAEFSDCMKRIAQRYQASCASVQSFVVIISKRVTEAWKISGQPFVVLSPDLSTEEMSIYTANAVASWLGLADEFEYADDAGAFTAYGPNCLPVAGSEPPSSWKEHGITAFERGCGDFPDVGMKPPGQTIMSAPQSMMSNREGFGAFNQAWLKDVLLKASLKKIQL